MNAIKLRAWDKKATCWQSLKVASLLMSGDNNSVLLHSDNLELMQYIQKDDKHDRHIFVGDILKIRISRHEGNGSHPNIHHGFYYLYAEVLDMRGNLRYNREAIKELEKPMGKEVFTQWVSYDHRLFGDLYWCMHHKKDKDDEYIIDKDDHGNWKRFYDFEVVGNMKETSQLMDEIKIMKVNHDK